MSTRIEPRIIEIFKKTSIKGHRSVILMIGRNSKKNVIYLHYLWSKINYKKKALFYGVLVIKNLHSMI